MNFNLETKDPELARERAIELYNNLSQLGVANELDAEISTFLSQRASRGTHSRATQKQRPYVLRKFSAWANARKLTISSFGEKDAERYYRYLQAQVSSKTGTQLSETTVQSYLSSGVIPFFEWLRVKRRVIFKNPFDAVELNKLAQHQRVRSDYCSAVQRDFILRECQRIPKTVISPTRAQWIAFVLHAGFEAGLRKNEIIQARPTWFDRSLSVLTVAPDGDFMPKNQKTRQIPITATFRKFLKKYPMKGEYCIAPKGKEKRRRKAGARVKKRRPLQLDATPKLREYRYDFEKPYKVVMKYIGTKLKEDLSRITPHIMRHTFATQLASGGVSVYKIAKWLGDTVKTTERHYAKVDVIDKDIEKLRSRRASRKRRS